MFQRGRMWVRLLSVFLAASGVLASEVSQKSETVGDRGGNSPWRIFGGLDAGLGYVSGDDYKSAPGGGLIHVNALASYLTPRWVYDGGVGWLYSNVDGQYSTGQRIDIRTRAATAELSARYRLFENWQLGPAFEMLFGSDTAFGPSVGSSVGTAMGGLRLAYETDHFRLPVRAIAQALTDIGIPNRRVLLFSAGIQIGFPVSVEHEKKQQIDHWEGSGDAIRVSQAAPIRMVLDAQRVFFGTNSAKVRGPVAGALNDIGEYLATHPENWSSVVVSGHADRRGRYGYNLKLSKHRAESVVAALTPSDHVENAERMHSEGYSYSQPIDPAQNAHAWAKNRRVEVVFRDVKDPAPLLKLISELPKGVLQ